MPCLQQSRFQHSSVLRFDSGFIFTLTLLMKGFKSLFSNNWDSILFGIFLRNKLFRIWCRSLLENEFVRRPFIILFWKNSVSGPFCIILGKGSFWSPCIIRLTKEWFRSRFWTHKRFWNRLYITLWSKRLRIFFLAI